MRRNVVIAVADGDRCLDGSERSAIASGSESKIQSVIAIGSKGAIAV